MGQACSNEANVTSEHDVDVSRLNLGVINILDFESRVKMYAHPMHRGRVTVDQLCTAFSDSAIFTSLKNPFSLVHKLLLSPFFR